MTEKRILRKQLQEELQTLPKQSYEHFSYTIAQSLFQTKEWQGATTIAITISKRPEVDTYQIIRKAWEEKRRIVIPKCDPKDKRMCFRTLTAFNQLESVFYGLLEPVEALTEAVPKEEIDLMIVPGLAYARNGYRLGFGGGYYDRYLSTYKGKTVSLAFHTQIVPTIPIDQHDIPVAKIITDAEIIDIYG